jgi:hypothetical protein
VVVVRGAVKKKRKMVMIVAVVVVGTGMMWGRGRFSVWEGRNWKGWGRIRRRDRGNKVAAVSGGGGSVLGGCRRRRGAVRGICAVGRLRCRLLLGSG